MGYVLINQHLFVKVYFLRRFQLHIMRETKDSTVIQPTSYFGYNKNQAACRVNLITQNYIKKGLKINI